ncbi:hypothetical protein F5X97DRAFT_279268 [Nemania serpens]|nr:hypothetical protein F5X97DRAFT_279268 [Nemania serpens]
MTRQGQRPKPGRFLVPARDSRHRTACLALFRALLRLAQKVSLPSELATGWGPRVRNPVASFVSRPFRRNRADNSPRIVHAALDAGYRMLSVLQSAAAAPGSEHHVSVTTFLAARLAERERSVLARSNLGPPPVDPAAPRPGTLPLLVDVTPPPTPANPSPRPEYATPHRPRPPEALGGTGRRKIPTMDMASDFPFLRLTKPQPPLLSRVLGQKLVKRAERATRFKDLGDDGLPAAQVEDDWERIVAKQVRREMAPRARDPGSGPGPGWQDVVDVGVGNDESSYGYTVHRHGVMHLSEVLTRERVDQVARADAMRKLIAQETALAAEEKVRRTAERRARWEARMLETHGERWRDLFPKLKDGEHRGR